FDDPEHGWIGISISDGITTDVIDVDSKFESFQGLTTALTGLAETHGEYRIWWLEEPGEAEWKFTKQQDEITFEARNPASGQMAIRFTGSFPEVCLPFWRALQSLKSRFTQQELQERIQDE